MEALEMKEKLNIKTAEKSLFNKWVEECLLLNNPVPCVNKESFKHMLDDCKEDSEPIVFISIGCQQFATVSDNNGDSLDIVTNLSTHAGSRADKWSKGIASMQKALTSFGITNTLFLTLSNVERIVLLLDRPGDQLVENIPAVSAQNTKTLSQLINDKGGNTIPFEHAQTLMQSFNVSKLEDLILHLLPNWRGEKLADTGIKGIDPLVRALYEVDPMQLPKTLTQNNKRVVWLDMMSELAGEDRDLLVSGVHQNDHEMPIFSPIMNGGKWDTGSDPLILFPDKKEFVSQILSIENTQDRLLWLQRLMGLSDSTVNEFLSSLGINFEINSLESKNAAIKLVESLVFGNESFNNAKVVREIVNNGQSIKTLIADITGQSNSHIFQLIKDGGIKVNGNTISNHTFVPEIGDEISVGKKLKLKIV